MLADPPKSISRVVALTSAGKRLIDAAFTEHMENERRLREELTPCEAERLEELLAKLPARIDESP